MKNKPCDKIKFVPRCNKDGSFAEVQCLAASRTCWCVDEHGRERNGTRQKKKPTTCQVSGPGNLPSFTTIVWAQKFVLVGGGSPEESFRFSRLHSLWAAEIQWDVPQWTSAEERDFEYTAISREVVGKNVHVKIPKGNMGYDQYTVPDAVAVEPDFSYFPLALANIQPWPLVSFIQFLWKTVNSKPLTIPFGIVAFTFFDNLSRNSCTSEEVHWGVFGFPLLKVSAGAKTERFLRVPPPPPNKFLRPQSLSPCPGLWASAEERDSKFSMNGSIKLTQVFLKIALGFLVLHAISS